MLAMSTSQFDKNAAEVLFKCGRHCCICRRFRPTMLQVHHIVERQDNGSDELDNLIAVCITCHSDAHTDRPFCRRFTPDELKQHRNRVYDMIANGTLLPPEDHHATSATPIRPPVAASSTEPFVVTVQGLVQPRLSNEAIEILIAAANSEDGQVLVFTTFDGYSVQVGEKNMVPSSKRRDEARYEEAISQLLTHGFLAGDREVLLVTHQGFLLADALEAVTKKVK